MPLGLQVERGCADITRMTMQALSLRSGKLIFWISMAAVCLGFALWYGQHYVPQHDIAIHLNTARLLSWSSVYGQDVWEVNPPLISLWFKLMLMGEAVGLGPAWWLHILAMGGLQLVSAALLWRALDVSPLDLLQRRVLVALWVMGGLLLSAFAYPQREVMQLFFMAPFVMRCAVLFAKAEAAPRSGDGLIFFLGLVGSLIKPPTVLLFGVLFLMAMLLKKTWWPMALAVAVVGALYGFLLWHWGWVQFYLSTQSAFNAYTPPRDMVQFLLALNVLPVLVITGLWAMSLKATPLRQMLLALGVACGLAYAAAALQNKGYYYHFALCRGLMVLAVALFVAAAPLRLRAVGAVVAAVLAVQALALNSWATAEALYSHAVLDNSPMAKAVATTQGPIAILGTELSQLHGLAEADGLRLTSRFPGFWTLPAQHNDIAALAKLGDLTAADFTARLPARVFVFSGRAEFRTTQALDYPALLSESAAFKAVWARYSRIGRVGDYDIYAPMTAENR